MKNIRYMGALFYYDGPQVIEARDAIGGSYVGVLLAPRDGRECFLLAGVEPERLRAFRRGSLDLRSLLLERAETDWFLGSPDALDPTAKWELKPQPYPLSDFSELPEPGFFLLDEPENPEARPIVEPLPGNAVHEADSVEFVGALRKADVDSGLWRIHVGDRDVNGRTKPGGPSLAGLKLESSYRFICVEEVEQSKDGREVRTVYLTKLLPA